MSEVLSNDLLLARLWGWLDTLDTIVFLDKENDFNLFPMVTVIDLFQFQAFVEEVADYLQDGVLTDDESHYFLQQMADAVWINHIIHHARANITPSMYPIWDAWQSFEERYL